MRDYVFVEKSQDCAGGLQSPWRKVKIVRETQSDVYVLRSDAGAEYAEDSEQLRVDRRCLEGTGEYCDPATGIAFHLWPRRFSQKTYHPNTQSLGFIIVTLVLLMASTSQGGTRELETLKLEGMEWVSELYGY